MSEVDVKKYQRGRGKPSRTIKDRKLRANLKRLDDKFQKAAISAAGTEYLLMEQSGAMEAEGEMEKTFKVTQDEIVSSVDLQTQKKRFDLKLDELGPYVHDYSRSGNSLLLGGSKGHVASFDWKVGKLNYEINVNETVRAVKWLQSDNQFAAVAQKKYTYIYDHQGVEVHQLKKHVEATCLEYLPYHFLLVTAGNTGFIKYQDVSTGQLVSELRTRLGATTCLTQNPYNAVIHAGHSNGTVTLWSPNSQESLVTILAAKGPIRACAVNRDGRYMVTAGADRSMKVWDIRNIKGEPLQSYYTPTPASSLSISETGMVAVGWGPHVQVWNNILTHGGPKQSAPYMNHVIPGSAVSSVAFCPFEDILGLGHAGGFSSLITPGSGEANFDAMEANNPLVNATDKGRREAEVRMLLNKLQPDMIALDPNDIGTIDKRSNEERLNARQAAELSERQAVEAAEAEEMKIRPKVKGKNSALRRHLRKKTQNVIDHRRLRIEQNLKREKTLRQKMHRTRQGLPEEKEQYSTALKRFK
ncbi:U3 small nucleolar RNA-associated protein 7 [Trichomonascus vanleenenianus]|uniref:Utp7p n=1 Tax=Trichomonascus vanleenenianus TaxID=2268995 RepID=UPI003EC9F05D